MTQLAAWLLALIGPLVVRAIIALGFTALVFTGVTELVNQLIASAQASWSTIPLAVLQLCSLSGIPESLGMLFGAYMARVAMWASVGAARYVLKSS